MRPMITREILLIKYCFMSAQMTQEAWKVVIFERQPQWSDHRSIFRNLVHSQADAEGPPTRSSPAALPPTLSPAFAASVPNRATIERLAYCFDQRLESSSK